MGRKRADLRRTRGAEQPSARRIAAPFAGVTRQHCRLRDVPIASPDRDRSAVRAPSCATEPPRGDRTPRGVAPQVRTAFVRVIGKPCP